MIVGAIPIKELSNRFPYKNFQKFNGDLLIHRAIRRIDPFVEAIFISTDAVDEVCAIVNEIRDTCTSRIYVHKRPSDLSLPHVGADAPVREVLRTHGVLEGDTVVMTQVTTPMIKMRTIERAICEFDTHKPDMLTVVMPDYTPSGGVYIFKAGYLYAHEGLYDGRVGLMLIPYDEGLDLDFFYQLRIAEAVEQGRIV